MPILGHPPITLILAGLLLATGARAERVTLDGGRGWGGWDYVANAQTNGVWLSGATNRTYSLYSTAFFLESDQTVAGVPLPSGPGQLPGVKADGTTYAGDGTSWTGNTAASLLTGSWRAGDRILGIGIQYSGSDVGTSFSLRRDKGGDTFRAASSVGASDGVLTYKAGDATSQVMAMWGWENQPIRSTVQVYSIFTADAAGGGANPNVMIRPYNAEFNGVPPALDLEQAPVRVFNILQAGSLNQFTSMQYLLNIDAVLRSGGGSGYGQGPFSNADRYSLWEGDFVSPGSSQVFGIAMDVPEPASAAVLLVGLGGLGLLRRRRAP